MKFKIVPDEATCKTCQDEYGPGNTPCLGCCDDVYEVIKLENDRVYYISNHKIKKAHIDYITIIDD